MISINSTLHHVTRYYNLKRGSSLDVSKLVEDIETYESRPLIFISKGKVESAIDLFCVFEFAKNKSLNFFDCIADCDDNVGSIGLPSWRERPARDLHNKSQERKKES
ncbi:hypothetical protein CW736_06135 [Nonlabens sp. MB-3u-79]|nr:hypothetical protein CW736_06135 [Nonlabens sp. MB-3u-79]